MSLEVLRAEFDAYKNQCSKERATLDSDIKQVLALMESKVSFKHFYWVIGILISIQMTVLGYIVLQNKDMSQQIQDIIKTSTRTQEDLSFLKGKLSPFDVQYSK